MIESTLLHELITTAVKRMQQSIALTSGAAAMRFGDLSQRVFQFSSDLMNLRMALGERVAIYLEKRFETVIASLGAPAAGCAFAPVNPLFKSEQVAFILRDFNVQVLVTSPERLALMADGERRFVAGLAFVF